MAMAHSMVTAKACCGDEVQQMEWTKMLSGTLRARHVETENLVANFHGLVNVPLVLGA